MLAKFYYEDNGRYFVHIYNVYSTLWLNIRPQHPAFVTEPQRDTV